MKRKYKSDRRSASAAQTRQDIVDAAVKLHGVGITTLAAVAEEAGVSLPTVAKHFPTREDLFEACTTHFMSQLNFPSPEALAAIPDPRERIARGVRELLTLHEQAFGQTWTGYRLESESETLARVMQQQEDLVAQMAKAIVAGTGEQAGDDETLAFVRGLLNPLAYRALRRDGTLDPEAAIRQMTLALARYLGVEVPVAQGA